VARPWAFSGAEAGRTARAVVGSNGQLDSLSAWLAESLDHELSGEEIGELDREALQERLLGVIDDRYRPEMRDTIRALPKKVPLGRLGTESEVSAAIAFLLSDRASGVTGVNLRVDGGWVVWTSPDGTGFPE